MTPATVLNTTPGPLVIDDEGRTVDGYAEREDVDVDGRTVAGRVARDLIDAGLLVVVEREAPTAVAADDTADTTDKQPRGPRRAGA